MRGFIGVPCFWARLTRHLRFLSQLLFLCKAAFFSCKAALLLLLLGFGNFFMVHADGRCLLQAAGRFIAYNNKLRLQ
jgi:hypothetical protein